MVNKEAAIKIIKKLRDNGHIALLAGGCVRDMLLDRPAKDYDVATSAHPKQVVKLFRRTLEIGAQFGVVMVLIDSEQVEVATFRTEAGYADGRHPGEVNFTDAQHDACRRDFTINGMFYDPVDEKILDYVNGQTDLRAGVIRTIGDPVERFSEDYLRMLRAVRFSTQLGFEIDSDTWDAICGNASNIINISGERIAMEIETILTNPDRANGFGKLMGSKLAVNIFPEYNAEIEYVTKVLENLPQKAGFALALSAIFIVADSDWVLRQLEILKLSNACQKHICFLLENLSRLLETDMPLADLKPFLASSYFQDLYDLQTAIQIASGQSVEPLEKIKQRAEKLEVAELTPKPLLNGHELIKLGVSPGPMVGAIGREMYAAQLNEELTNTDEAEKWVQNRLKHPEGDK